MVWFLRREIILIICLAASFLLTGRSYMKGARIIERESRVEKRINHEELIAENIRLRDILSIKHRDTYFSSFILSDVLSVKPHVFPVEMVINRGISEGISEGMVALSKDAFLVGRVSEARENNSTVMTVFNADSNVSVFIESTGEVGILEGGRVPYSSLKYISNESGVKTGDRVITSGYSDFYPLGIAVGEVVRISKVRDSLFFNILVRPYIGFSYINEVLVGE